jgi:hypothetical protein
MSDKTSIELTSTKDIHWEYSFSLSCFAVVTDLSHLLGKVLTLIDASVTDPRQNKALKDLIKTEFSTKATHFRAKAMPEGMGESGYKLSPSFD